MSAPLVSVIIPTHNESAVISRNLESLKDQKYPRVEIIVVDDESTDQTAEIAKKFTTNVFMRTRAERSVQRNFGASKSHGKFLLFLDADMELTQDVISDCVKLAEKNPEVGAIAIPEKPIANNFLEQVKAFERSFYSEKGDPDTDAARFILTTAFKKVGGYDVTLTGPEDWDLPERVSASGYKVTRISSLINHYERIPSLWKLIKKKYYYGLTANRYLVNRKLSPIGPKTIYFLRPVFYRNWRKLISHPVLTMGMVIVLSCEQLSGVVGYLVGKYSS